MSIFYNLKVSSLNEYPPSELHQFKCLYSVYLKLCIELQHHLGNSLCPYFSVSSSTTPSPNQSRVTIRNLEGQDEIIYRPHVLFCTRRRISVGWYACLGVDNVVKVKASSLPWIKLERCRNIVNSRQVSVIINLEACIILVYKFV